MKRVAQTNLRKVYGGNMQQFQQLQHQESQINAVRKIHNLLSSGAVTVTGPTQPRTLKQRISGSSTTQNNQTMVNSSQKCYVCDDPAGIQPMLLAETATATSNTKLPNKIAQIIGEGFVVIISVDDIVCKKCLAMINHLDRLEADSERVKKNVLNYLNKKYNLSEDDEQIMTPSPPTKMQRMNSGNISRKIGEDDQDSSTRKITIHSVQTTRDQLDNQLTSIFESGDNKNITVTQTKVIAPQSSQNAIQQQQIKKPMKIYKCLSCEFKTTDYKQFQPHYETCKQQNGFTCKICKKIFINSQVLKQHILDKHPTENICNLCNLNFLNESTLKKHIELNHPELKMSELTSTNISGTQITSSSLYSCNFCQHKTTDKQNYDDHIKKHMKMKPFKCRLCSVRFETREQASTHAKSHQPNYFKCGTCSASFTQRDQLVKHFEIHQSQNKGQIQQQQQTQVLTTQKLLQDTIDEALREPSEGLDTKGIHFFSCNVCSLTFIQENYYNQHMETHKRDNNKKLNTIVTTASQNITRQETKNTNSNILASTTQQSSTISEADIESMFEKMHSDKGDGDGSGNTGGQSNENLVITSQENSVGDITFNITISPENSDQEKKKPDEDSTTATSESVPVGIDMPVLDEPSQSKTDTAEVSASDSEQQNQSQSAPVSMPSLDDDGDSQSQPSNTDQVPMDLDDMQNSVENNQIKFILNESGQFLQLENHIITTDAEGNQILVQGTDSEQFQQLLQTVSLDGETLQMISGDNNQMIIVQGDNEAQLIDASLLNAEGHIVIQQAQDGELSDGAQVPVSVAFATHEQGIHLDGNSTEHHDNTENQVKDNEDKKSEEQNGVTMEQNTPTTQSLQTSTGESFFALEDLMQQPEQKSSD